MSYSIKAGLSTLGVIALCCMMSPKVGAQEKVATAAAKKEIVVGKELKVAIEKATAKVALGNTKVSNQGSKAVSQSPAWFVYTTGSRSNPLSYQFTTHTDMTIATECPTGEDILCAIKVLPDSNGDRPDQAALNTLQQEIQDALDDGENSDNVRLKAEEQN